MRVARQQVRPIIRLDNAADDAEFTCQLERNADVGYRQLATQLGTRMKVVTTFRERKRHRGHRLNRPPHDGAGVGVNAGRDVYRDDRAVTVVDDIDRIANTLETMNEPRLLVFDPISSHLGDTDTLGLCRRIRTVNDPAGEAQYPRNMSGVARVGSPASASASGSTTLACAPSGRSNWMSVGLGSSTWQPQSRHSASEQRRPMRVITIITAPP